MASTNDYSKITDEGKHQEPDIEEGFDAVPNNGEGPEPDRPEEESRHDNRKALGMIKENTFIEFLAGGLAVTSVGVSVASMIVTSSFVVNGAGILACLIGPYSYWQQRNLTDAKSLQETHDALVKEVDHLRSENERLKGLTGEMRGTIDRLEDVNDTFDYIQELNFESVQELKQQVDEGKVILSMMRKNLKASALQNVITVVLNSDTDGNYTFDKDEIETLIVNLKSINGLELNEKRFRTIISENDGSVDGVVTILNDIVHNKKHDQESIFNFV